MINEVPGIPGALLSSPQVYGDVRGSFVEIFREDDFADKFVQANHSHSARGVLRGLHWHRRQADAWYVISGHAQAMLADLRNGPGESVVASIDLIGGEPRVLYIPPGVAHGFLAVTDVDLIYWVTQYYDSTDEYGVAWDDPALAAPWMTKDPVLSDRDKNNPPLETAGWTAS